MAEAIRRPRTVEQPGFHLPASPSEVIVRPAGRAAEARQPVHLTVLVGLTAGAYAAALAGVTALQAVADRDLAASNAPAADVLTMLTIEHDRLEARLTTAGSTYGTAAAAYSDITDQLALLEDKLGKLAAQVKKVEGSASWVPPVVRMPSVSRGAPQTSGRATRPASNGSSGASGH